MNGFRPVVCHLLHGMRVGGAEVLAARIARQTCDRYRYCFVCLDELGTLGEELREQGFPVDVIHRRPGLDWRCPLRLSRRLAERHVHLIHAHQYTPFFYALVSRLFHGSPKILFTEHGRHQPDYPRRKRILFNRLALQRGDRVVGVGEVVRRALITNEGIPAQRVRTLYNGVNLSSTESVSPEQRQLARREMQLADDELAVIQVARLDPIKDHLTALRAFQLTAHRHHNARFIIVGEGPEQERIAQYVSEQHLQGRVRMLGLRNDVPKLLSGADLFMLSSLSEGIPLTVIEAMGARLPVVSTNAGGVGEVIEHERTGLLAPVADHVQLAEHLMRLAGQPDLRRRMGEDGRRTALERFYEPKMLEQYDLLYREMLRL